MTETLTPLEAAPGRTDEQVLLDEMRRSEIGSHTIGGDSSHGEILTAHTDELADVTDQLSSRISQELMEDGNFDSHRLLEIDRYLQATEVIGNKRDRIFEASRLASMLGAEAESPEELEQARRRQQAFEDLLQRGATPLAARQVLGNADGLDYYIAAVTDDKQRDVIAMLASTEGLQLDMYRADGVSNAGHMALDYPELFDKAVAVISEQYGGAMLSGYPKDKLTKTVEDFFGAYTMNKINQGNNAEPINDQYADIIESELKAIQLVGEKTAAIQEILVGDKSGYDLLMLGVADQLRSGEVPDQDTVRSVLDSTAQHLSQLRHNHPDVLEALRLTKAAFSDDPYFIENEVMIANKLAPDFAFLRETMGVENKDVFTRIDSNTWRQPETGAFRPELFDAIEQLKQQVANHPNLDSRLLLGAYLYYPHTTESLEQFGDFLARDDVAELVQEPTMARAINRALFTIAMYGGSFDFTKDIGILRSINDEDPSILSEIIRADVDTNKYGKIFHDIAQQVLARQDRDGNLFDAPRTLSRVIDRFANNDNDHQDIRWFVASELPVSAMDTVMQFRQKALEKGVSDDPKEIYRWIFDDPEHIQEMSRENLESYVVKLGAMTLESGERVDITPDVARGLIESAHEMVVGMEDDFRIFVNMNSNTIEQIMDGSGVIRSTFEQDGSKVLRDNRDYRLNRSGIEVALGIRLLDATNETQPHPVYGSAVYIGDGIPEGAVGYGDIALSFKPEEELAAAITFSPEDSFHGAQRLTMNDAKIARLLKTVVGRGSILTADYVEAQISAPLSLDNVDAVYVPNEATRQALPESLREKAVVRVLGSPDQPSQYDGHREQVFARQHFERIGLIQPLPPQEPSEL